MTDEIKSRIERLIGEYRFRTVNADTNDIHVAEADYQFDKWHQDLIERLARDARVMSGLENRNLGWAFGDAQDAYDTHTALILDVQPIKRGVSKSEVVRFITDMQKPSATWTLSEMKDLKRRIETEGMVSDE